MTTFRIVGPGRAGRSLSIALVETGGFEERGLLGRKDPVEDAARGVELLVIATPDADIAAVAAAVRPERATTVIHLSGSLGLDVLAPHGRRGSLHPLAPLPDPVVGARRLASGMSFAVDGDPIVGLVVEALAGRALSVADGKRANYHAAACIAANHLVALIGQVERVAASAGLPLDAFAGMLRAATDDALALGPGAALTGPASRGDWATLERHRLALAGLEDPASEMTAYDAMVDLAHRLVTMPAECEAAAR